MNASALVAVLSAGACADFTGGQCASTECADDAKIQAEVKRQIDERSSLRFFNINVRTVNRVVYLEGLVDTNVDRGLAKEIARAVPDVKAVYDNLNLNNGTSN
jgi:osmotically-inducible protein OsmY